MDQEQVIRIAEEYAEVVKNNLPVQKVVLYGSYINGIPTEDSDIDIAVIVDSVKDKDFLKTSAKLFQLTINVDTRIEPVLFKTDTDDLSGFLESILSTGKVIYDKQQKLYNNQIIANYQQKG
jgi:uncharacterized protein